MSTDTPAPEFPPGWYDSTERPGMQGFWDGTEWTGEYRPVEPIDERRSPFAKKTPEQKEAKAAAKAQREEDRELQRFLQTPVGQARTAHERGDKVFQYECPVRVQQAVILAMVGSTVRAQTSDPSMILNAVCAEGWDLVNGSFVFVETGQQSRDKFMTSGQNVAIRGSVVGYYLFRRDESHA